LASLITALTAPALLAQEVQQGAALTGVVSTAAGPRNAPLYDGAQALQAGHTEEGVRLTLEGLSVAQGKREEETALSNLCAGYLRLRQFAAALNYCNLLLERNENAWRAYNTRAMVYLELEQYEKADQDLKRAEAINPDAKTLKAARAQYMDTVHPVAPEVEIDDRNRGESAQHAR
jgi:tetratricopeptide (TPR) repeat protein